MTCFESIDQGRFAADEGKLRQRSLDRGEQERDTAIQNEVAPKYLTTPRLHPESRPLSSRCGEGIHDAATRDGVAARQLRSRRRDSRRRNSSADCGKVFRVAA